VLSQAHTLGRNLSAGGDAASGPGGTGSTCCEGCSWGMVALWSLSQSSERSCFVGRGGTPSSGRGSDVNDSVAKSTKKTLSCWCCSETLPQPAGQQAELNRWPEQALTQTAQVCCCSLGLAKMALAKQPALLLQACSLGAFMISVSSAYECLDFVSVRLVPQKAWSSPAKKGWRVLPAHTKLGAGVCPPAFLG